MVSQVHVLVSDMDEARWLITPTSKVNEKAMSLISIVSFCRFLIHSEIVLVRGDKVYERGNQSPINILRPHPKYACAKVRTTWQLTTHISHSYSLRAYPIMSNPFEFRQFCETVSIFHT